MNVTHFLYQSKLLRFISMWKILKYKVICLKIGEGEGSCWSKQESKIIMILNTIDKY